ncbi:unnamed protein product, partial [Echinostoma caproni]|uniref:DUF1758 domain-containing protein n=1 Tax=Echinostoma caproni TaxID=27848 RepID=A0A183A1K6_9TREM
MENNPPELSFYSRAVSENSADRVDLERQRLDIELAKLRLLELDKRIELKKLQLLQKEDDGSKEVKTPRLIRPVHEYQVELPKPGNDNIPAVALAVVPVTILYGGRKARTLALLDSGSDSSLILDDLVTSLQMKGKLKDIIISTLNKETTIQTTEVEFEIEPD